MYDSDLTIEELRERQRRNGNTKYIKREPCSNYEEDYSEDEDRDYPEDRYTY